MALAWALHAGIDWDWEMPAVTLPIFVLAGAALGRPAATGASRSRWRPVVGFVVLIVAVVPALLSVSQRRLDSASPRSTSADCATATIEARSSLQPLRFRHAAHEILAYCHAARGEPEPGSG